MKRAGKAVSLALLTVALGLGMLVGCGRKPRPAEPGSPAALPSATATEPSVVPSTDPSTPAPPTDSTTAGSGATVVSSRVAYQWHWPNDANRPGTVAHQYAVPPVPQLVRIGVGDHSRDPGERPFNRMSFMFTTAFP